MYSKPTNHIHITHKKYTTWSIKAPNDQIIIFGGITDNYVRPSPDIAVLNTKTEPFEWIATSVSSNIEKIDKFPSLTGHTANLVGNYMIVAFGKLSSFFFSLKLKKCFINI